MFKGCLISWFILMLLFTPLMPENIFEAVKNGDLEQVRTLLQKNSVLLNTRGEYGQSPIMQAAISRQPGIFKFLLEQGADVSLLDKEGFSPLQALAYTGERELAELLIDRGAPIDADNNSLRASPLHLAVRGNHADVIRMLIDKGASFTLKDINDETPFICAISLGHMEIARLFLQNGASIHDKDSTGNSPLLLAALNGEKEFVEILIAKGADINEKNVIGGSPASVAAREGRQDIVELLIAKGADKNSLQPPILKGTYLGQKNPGMNPERFAPGVVSTEKRELNSVFSPDGREFYFSIQTAPMKWKIMVMKQQKNGWTKPETVSFSGRYSDADPFISPNGKQLFYCSNRPLQNGGEPKKDFDIWMVEREKLNGEWSEPRNLGAPVNSEESEFYPTVAGNGALYFQASRPDSRGARDIYRSRPVTGRFEKIENVGDAVNSVSNEGDVLIYPDENRLIFSSSRPGGFGQGDLYISFRDKSEQWSPPINMGESINTANYENCPVLSPDMKFLFFTRNGDIYWVDAKIADISGK